MMTSIHATNLSVQGVSNWNDLDWKTIETQVDKLKSRIFAAAKRGDGKTVYSLQKLMVKSSNNLLLCIRKSTSLATGRNSPGIDLETYLTPSDRMALFAQLTEVNFSHWKPVPARRIYIPKPDGRQRPLSVPTISDRVVQGVMRNALEPEWEAYFEPSSYGFRPGKTYNDAAHYVFTLLSKKTRLWILDADIKGCFDNIDHKFLVDRLAKFPYVDIISRWLKGGFYYNGFYEGIEVATPQGGVISPLLCNIALHGLEKDLNIIRDNLGYISARNNLSGRTIVRFADDFVIFCPSKKEAEKALSDVNKVLVSRGLQISEAKTRIIHASAGFDFVGFNFRHFYKKRQGIFAPPLDTLNSYPVEIRDMISTLVTPTEKSIKNISGNLSKVFHDYRGKPAHSLISKLNPIIRGYAESKRCWSVSQAFRRLDNHLYYLQTGWTRRSHPKKNVGWITGKYFKHHKDMFVDSRWTFFGPSKGNICQKFIWHGKQRKYPPVVGSYSPFDASIKEYWEKRTQTLFLTRCFNLSSTRDRMLAYGQMLICPVCDQSLFREYDRLEIHHVIPKKQGGSDRLNNLLILHYECHSAVHYGSKEEEWIPILQQFKDQCNYSMKKDLENPYL